MEAANASVVVAGGASGLGAGCVRRFVGLGAQVAILDVDEARGSALAGTLGCGFHRVDVADADEVAAALDAITAGHGPIRIVVNTAGIGGGGVRVSSRQGAHPLPMFRAMLDVHVVGTFNLLRLSAERMAAAPPLAGGERGVFVATSSIVAEDGPVGMVAYAAAKSAIEGMVLPAARDLAPAGIRVACISPGCFDTPMFRGGGEEGMARALSGQPFPKRAGTPDEFASLVQHICDNQMLNGTTLRLDGALRLHVSGAS